MVKITTQTDFPDLACHPQVLGWLNYRAPFSSSFYLLFCLFYYIISVKAKHSIAYSSQVGGILKRTAGNLKFASHRQRTLGY